MPPRPTVLSDASALMKTNLCISFMGVKLAKHPSVQLLAQLFVVFTKKRCMKLSSDFKSIILLTGRHNKWSVKIKQHKHNCRHLLVHPLVQFVKLYTL